MATYREYIRAAMLRAQYEQLPEGEWYASIPGFEGLWATGASVEEAREELMETLDGWLVVNFTEGKNHPPVIDGVVLYSSPERVE